MKDFKKLVLSETPNIYRKMQEGETESPYIVQPTDLSQYKTYSLKRDEYLNRLKNEMEIFNNTLHIVTNKHKERLSFKELRQKERKERIKRSIFFFMQFLITLVCILPIGFLDYIGIRYLVSRFSKGESQSLMAFLEDGGFPTFLGYILSTPLWVGVVYAFLASLILKMGEKVYTRQNYRKYALSRLGYNADLIYC